MILKLIGIGLAAAILIDAVIMRMVRAPTILHLLGGRAWWTPSRRAPDPAPDAERA